MTRAPQTPHRAHPTPPARPAVARRAALIALALAAALLVLLPVACRRGGDAELGEPRPLRLERRAVLQVAGRPVEVELARESDEIQLGLMYRRSLPDDQGMLFLFTSDRQRSFYMRNVPIPLDICFLSADGEVLNIVTAEPLREEPKALSDGPARYVLELAGGWAERHGLEPGDRVEVGAALAAQARHP